MSEPIISPEAARLWALVYTRARSENPKAAKYLEAFGANVGLREVNAITNLKFNPRLMEDTLGGRIPGSDCTGISNAWFYNDDCIVKALIV